MPAQGVNVTPRFTFPAFLARRADEFSTERSPMRPSGRRADQLRAISLEPGFAKYAEGSCLIRFGDTHVLCTASVDEKVPPFLRNTGRG